MPFQPRHKKNISNCLAFMEGMKAWQDARTDYTVVI